MEAANMIPSVCYTYTQQGTKIIIIIYRNTRTKMWSVLVQITINI